MASLHLRAHHHWTITKCFLILSIFFSTLSAFNRCFGDHASEDTYTSPYRLPDAFELILLYGMSWSKLEPGVAESKNSVEKNEDDQLMQFRSLVAHLERGFGQQRLQYEGAKITSLEQYIRITRPYRIADDTVDGTIRALDKILESAEPPVAYSINPFTKELGPFANDKIKLLAQGFEERSARHMASAMETADNLVGMATFSAFGNLVSGLNQVADIAGVVDGVGIASDLFKWARTFGDLFPETEGLGFGAARQELFRSKDPNAEPPTISKAPAMTSLHPGKTGKVPDLGRSENRNVLSELAAHDDSEAISRRLRQAHDRFQAVAQQFEGFEQKLIKYIVAFGKMNRASQLKVVKFIQDKVVRPCIQRMNEVGSRVMKDPQVQEAMKDPRAGAMLRLFEVILNRYPASMKVSRRLNMMLALLRTYTGASDIAALGAMMDFWGPLPKNFAQVLSSHAPPGFKKVAAVLSRQQNRGRRIANDDMKSIVAHDPNQYQSTSRVGGYVGELDFSTVRSGKLFQVAKAPGMNADGTSEAKAVRVIFPDAEDILAEDEQIFKAMAPELAEVIGRDAIFERNGITAKTVLTHVKTVLAQTDRERNIPLTVEHQRKIGGQRYHQQYAIPSDAGLVVTTFRTPEPWDAVENSRVMISRWVEDAIDFEEFSEREPELAQAVGYNIFRLVNDELVLKPLRAINNGESEEARSGVINFDLHPGNVMIRKPKHSLAKHFPFLLEEGKKPDLPVIHIEVEFPDYGLATTVAPQIVHSLLLLIVGASANHTSTITEALWNLQTESVRLYAEEEAKKKSWFLGIFPRIFAKSEKMEHAVGKYVADGKSYSEIKAIVSEKAKELHRRAKYWDPGEWIQFVVEFLNLHPDVLAVDRGYRTAKFLFLATHNTKYEERRFVEIVKQDYKWDLFRLLRKTMGLRAAIGVGVEAAQFAVYNCRRSLLESRRDRLNERLDDTK